MSIKQGYIFEDEIRRSILKLQETGFLDKRLWLYKMVDTHSFSYVKNFTNKHEFIVPKVPADFLLLYDGKPMFLEAKMTSRKTSYDLTWIKDHQIENGLELMAQGVPYYFIINQRYNDTKKKVGEAQDFAVYIMNAQTIASLRSNLRENKKRSAKWETMAYLCDKHIPPNMRDTKDGTWDLSWLFTDGFTLPEQDLRRFTL